MQKLLLLSTFLLICLQSCQKNIGDPLVDTSQDVESMTMSDQSNIYYSIIDDLRVRTAPDTDAQKIASIPYGGKVIYLGEESDTKEAIKLRGIVKKDKWKKVKVSVGNSSAEIIGWAFGGGLIQESKMYTKRANGLYEQAVTRAKASEIEELLDLMINEDYQYQGFINYQKDSTGNYQRHGKFSIENVAADLRNEPQRVSIVYTGSYSDGNKNGSFIKKVTDKDVSTTATLFFENNTCYWAAWQQANHLDPIKIDKPSDCSFAAIEAIAHSQTQPVQVSLLVD